ncbi:hypothetical protein CH333_08190 [candidate division WOR-3 bacterium JGI_Cruoil_03_44_89]|uniref:HicB-like antitoxin of toxin-antitoxin system domain-containing protein n=1 Tax=candidate division WOR-3 bacterium JGI_Cruoil_03_44_89 TaxID=1973748 RepID=A0A235BPF7_UNCW3|nr:MAG: hypothetical protein CH333_08190 [candidate division WOR-3 bacterium JGI_Cruoil_03_44_89]
MKTVGYVMLTFEFRKRGRRWTAYCKELGTATFGRSLPEVQERIEEAVLLHLNTLEDVGERERFFKENNITFYPHKPKTKEVTISAPFDRATFVHPYIQPLKELAST